MALGNIERGKKKFADCAVTYSQGIDVQAAMQDKPNWVSFYFRGICEERSKQWTKAEADMRKALELQPEQPHVLNYLGYSWIDQGINLDDAMKMIKRAVDQRPDDGYIVDSLGWAYYRIGNFEEAAKTLERAIDLKPEDPDHQRTISAMPTGASAAPWKPNSSGSTPRTLSRKPKNCRRSKPRSRTACRTTSIRHRRRRTRKRRRQGRLRRLIERLGRRCRR